MKKSFKRNNRFSLTELIVVAAILAVSAAFLPAVVAEAQTAAGLDACSANLKKIGTAYNMYAEENDGFMAVTDNFVPDGQGYYPRTWYAKVYDYVEDADPFLCPSQPEHRKETVRHAAMTGLDYEVNIQWMGKDKKLVKAPEKTILLTEVGNQCRSSYFYVPWTFSKVEAERNNGVAFRHDGYAATFRADGSVGAINEAELQRYMHDASVRP